MFFDFDGTLVNSQRRLFNLFRELCPTADFSYEEYWKIKRNRVTQKDFLIRYCDFDKDRAACFRRQWLSKVEEKARVLNEDIPVDGIDPVLRALSRTHELYLLTNRQSRETTEDELKKFGWLSLFEKILVTEQKTSKPELVRANVPDVCLGDCFIGDTGEDVKTAKEFGAKAVAVGWGVIDRAVLQSYDPDKIIDTVGELEEYFDLWEK